ncbi:tRNA (N6-threonylcarbamoyladenosine(37)-N6)-methyltransferase TrmO [Psychromonas sp. MME2]|uniref:tRNA (N6-threonylcarbamoyladenosine(37)-N6)-methyltransferase TrmO n=1 Tax=unclassified Psychromonas TaxID=2614957 RepID=UPI00339D0CD0
MPHLFHHIGLIHSPYKEKFAVPRQPGLVTCAKGELEILAPYNDLNAFNGLEAFSHLWLIFVFHKNNNIAKSNGWSPTVRPPRLGGNERMGVFATRSPFRPNPIGLSQVRYHGLRQADGKIFLQLSEIDLVDGTPIIDIKPYIPYADSNPAALAGFAQEKPEGIMDVHFSSLALQKVQQVNTRYPELQQLIKEVLQQDPRPAYKKKKVDDKIYAVNLSDFNISWRNDDSTVTVLDIESIA